MMKYWILLNSANNIHKVIFATFTFDIETASKLIHSLKVELCLTTHKMHYLPDPLSQFQYIHIYILKRIKNGRMILFFCNVKNSQIYANIINNYSTLKYTY